MDLSILVPAYNEESTIQAILGDLIECFESSPEVRFEIIVVDDGSTDRTAELVGSVDHPSIQLVQLSTNGGKGAAVQQAIRRSSGRLLLVQDADTEYFPTDIPRMLDAIGERQFVAVYGSRTLGARRYESGLRRYMGIWRRQGLPQRLANYLLSALIRLRLGSRISDPLTGYKLYPRFVFDEWRPQTKGFETDHEITVRLIRQRFSIVEVPIHYNPRTKAEGKKIRARDFLRAVRVLSRF